MADTLIIENAEAVIHGTESPVENGHNVIRGHVANLLAVGLANSSGPFPPLFYAALVLGFGAVKVPPAPHIIRIGKMLHGSVHENGWHGITFTITGDAVGQDVRAGTRGVDDASLEIHLVINKIGNTKKIIGQPINEVKQALIDLNYIDVTYINDKTGEDVTYTIETLTEEEYVDWNVIGAIDVSTPAMRRMEIRLEKVLKEYQLFIDISFTENSFSNKDNIELRLLNEDVSVGKYILPHGKPFSKLITVTEGEYSLAFYKENAFTVNNHTESFTISGDLTFSCNISITSNGITIENENTSSSLEGSALTVPSVVGLTLTQASQNLTECGFVNLEGMKENGETAGSLSTWVVISQSVSEGETLTKADLIVLTCMKADDYMKQKYENAALGEVKAEIEAMGFSSISYKLNFLNDITTTISQADQASLAKYTITSTTTTNNKITIYLQFAE